MLTIPHTTVTREEVWTAFRHTPEARWRERSHRILLRMEGSSCPAIAPWWSREAETRRGGVHACHEAGLAGLTHAPMPGHPA
jgi:hypothetical protein